jgi:hypothetical protein
MEQSFDTTPFDFLSPNQVMEKPLLRIDLYLVTESGLKSKLSEERGLPRDPPHPATVKCITKISRGFFLI